MFPGIVTFPASLFILYKLINLLSKTIVFDKEIIGGIIALLGFFFATALFTEYSVFVFKIKEQTLFWKKLVLSGKKTGVVPFVDIKNVVLQSSSTGSFEQVLTYRLALETKDKVIPLTRYYTAGTKDKYKSIRDSILAVLGKDSSRFIEDSILETVLSGKKIQAIKLARDHYKINFKEAEDLINDLLK